MMMNLAHVMTDSTTRSLKKCSTKKVLVCILIGVPLYNEFLSYILQSWLWSSLHLSGR